MKLLYADKKVLDFSRMDGQLHGWPAKGGGSVVAKVLDFWSMERRTSRPPRIKYEPISSIARTNKVIKLVGFKRTQNQAVDEIDEQI